MQNLLPSFLGDEESLAATTGRPFRRGQDSTASTAKKSWDPQRSQGDSLVKLPRYLVDNSQNVDDSVFVPIRQEATVKTKSEPMLPSAPPNLRYLPVIPDPTPSPLSRHERGDSEAPVIAVPLDLIRKKRVQPDKSGDARSLVLSLFNKCPTSLSVFSQTMPTVKFGEIEPHSEDILLAASLRSLRCEGDQHQHQQLVPGCVVPLLVAPLKVITAKLGPQQKIQDFQFRPGPVGMEVECKNGRLICVRVVPNSQSSFYYKSVLGAEVLAVNDNRVMSLQEFVSQLHRAQHQSGDFVRIKMSSFVGARLKADGITSFTKNKKHIKTLFSSLLSPNDRTKRRSLDNGSETSKSSTTTTTMSAQERNPVVPSQTAQKSLLSQIVSRPEEIADDNCSKLSDTESELTSSVFDDDFGIGKYQSYQSKKGIIAGEEDETSSLQRVSKKPIARFDSGAFDGEQVTDLDPLFEDGVLPDAEANEIQEHFASGQAKEDDDSQESGVDQTRASSDLGYVHKSSISSPEGAMGTSLSLELSNSILPGLSETVTPFKRMEELSFDAPESNGKLPLMHIESQLIEAYESSNTLLLDGDARPEDIADSLDGSDTTSTSSEDGVEDGGDNNGVQEAGCAREEVSAEEVWDYTTALQSGEEEPLRAVICAPSALKRSENGWGDPKSYLHFANFSQAYVIEISWVDEDGMLVFRRRLRCGERHNEITSAQHVWFVTATFQGRADSRRRQTPDPALSESVGTLSHGNIVRPDSSIGTMAPGNSDIAMLFRCAPALLHDHRSTLISWTPWSSLAVAQKLRVSASNSADSSAADSPHVSILIFDSQQGAH